MAIAFALCSLFALIIMGLSYQYWLYAFGLRNEPQLESYFKPLWVATLISFVVGLILAL